MLTSWRQTSHISSQTPQVVGSVTLADMDMVKSHRTLITTRSMTGENIRQRMKRVVWENTNDTTYKGGQL